MFSASPPNSDFPLSGRHLSPSLTPALAGAVFPIASRSKVLCADAAGLGKARRHDKQSLLARTDVAETEAFQERRCADILHGRLLCSGILGSDILGSGILCGPELNPCILLPPELRSRILVEPDLRPRMSHVPDKSVLLHRSD